MRPIVVTSDMTIKRVEVIKSLTQSEILAGMKAQMIADLKRKMRNGLAHFAYLKKDGTIREAFGTTNAALIEYHVNGRGVSREKFFTTAYFDVEAADWRSFRWENIVAVE